MLIPLLQNNQNFVASGGGGPILIACPVLDLIVGTTMTPVQVFASGGTAPYTFSQVGLPSGLTMSTGGVISGTPTLVGIFPYSITVIDSVLGTATVSCALDVMATLDHGDDGLGIIRYLDEISNAVVVSSETDGFGDLVQVDGIHTFGDFGIIGPVYKENLSLRIEYRRHGKVLSDTQPFEIPDRYTKYVRHYVLARALEREGPGQDLILSAHFQARWEAGIARMLKRKSAMEFQKAQVMGGSSTVRGQKPPRPRLPWQYGHIVK